MGVAHLVDALVDGEASAEGEDHEGHDERPEVALTPVAERMLLRRPLGGSPHAEKQQRLVAGVGNGVDRLGQHGGGAREGEPHELGRGDTRVGQQSGDDRLGPYLSGHGSAAQPGAGEAGTRPIRSTRDRAGVAYPVHD